MMALLRAAACVAALTALPLSSWGQAPAPPAPGQPPAPGAAGGRGAAQAPVVELEPQGFDYNPEGRRDPFVSLVRRGSAEGRSAAAPRPPGLAGLETAEVTLRGTLQSGTGYIAMLQGSDPLSLEKQREVRKTIRQTDEGK
jgi:hypothetical protein